MTRKKEEAAFTSVSSDAVREATGRGWDEWLELLDRAGAMDWSHKEIVAHLAQSYADVTTSWWRQSITVAYEKARGKRVLGETAAAGFEVGVSRTVAAPRQEVWELITSRPELWMGEGASVSFEPKRNFEVPGGSDGEGLKGEIRVVKDGQRIRMTWHPEGWQSAATKQITLTEKGPEKTAIGVHFEKLPDADAREAMREKARGALERIASAIGG
jgi:uncharacterized protein YndB with AHSA1/START domain